MVFFDNFFKKKSSGEVAKDRLKLLLVSDRSNCSPETMELIKNDIIKVISKYMEIDPDGLDIQITQNSEESEGPALYSDSRAQKITLEKEHAAKLSIAKLQFQTLI